MAPTAMPSFGCTWLSPITTANSVPPRMMATQVNDINSANAFSEGVGFRSTPYSAAVFAPSPVSRPSIFSALSAMTVPGGKIAAAPAA